LPFWQRPFDPPFAEPFRFIQRLNIGTSTSYRIEFSLEIEAMKKPSGTSTVSTSIRLPESSVAQIRKAWQVLHHSTIMDKANNGRISSTEYLQQV
jgi:hypothetical protein